MTAGVYENLHKDIFSVFGAAGWVAESITTFPENFTGAVSSREYIRIKILANTEGLNISSIAGLLMIDIFVPAGGGPLRSSQIADRLDAYLVGRSLHLSSGHTQFWRSSLSNFGLDTDNASLFRSIYSIPFNHFGV